jgi:hypothetical protein
MDIIGLIVPMVESPDLIIFWVVIAARFLLPILIPYYPLPGILVCLVLDGVDQTIFQSFESISLDNYQGYDKALDTYYLTVAYTSTLRNWTDHFAYRLVRFLFYYRLVGVALFELIQWRPFLLIFPNTFEYLFIFYEIVRIWWDPQRLTNRQLLGAAAFIWIIIKLPQEYWLHVAQLDATDVLGQLWQTRPALVVIAAVLLLLIAAAVWRWLKPRLPPAEHPPSLAAGRYAEGFTDEQIRQAMRKWAFRIFDRDLLEKVVLLALLALVFTQVIPGARAEALQIAIGVVIVTIVNTILSHWLARRGYGLPDTIIEFVVVAAVNLAVIFVYNAFIPGEDNIANSLFFVVLLTLIITLFDRFQQVHLMRFPGRLQDEG